VQLNIPDSVRLLLVEDDLLMQKIVLRLLKRLGYDADIASDGLEAIEMSSTKNYDIIFMDLHMPGLDGLSAASAISQSKRSGGCLDKPPVIIAMTADDVGSDFDHYRAAGITDWIAKPVQGEILKQAIEKRAANASAPPQTTSLDPSPSEPSGDSAVLPPDHHLRIPQ
jgi:CheY-like chemotaxis protein